MELEGSLPFPQELATGPHSEPDASSPHPPTLFRSDCWRFGTHSRRKYFFFLPNLL